MGEFERKQMIENNKRRIWEKISFLEEKPIYPAIIRRLLIASHDGAYYDHELDYEEKYTEWLAMRQGFIVAYQAEKLDLQGIGDAVILDIKKHELMRVPRVTRCGLVLPMVSYQGCTCQPQDFITYFENILSQIESYKGSSIKKSLRC